MKLATLATLALLKFCTSSSMPGARECKQLTSPASEDFRPSRSSTVCRWPIVQALDLTCQDARLSLRSQLRLVIPVHCITPENRKKTRNSTKKEKKRGHAREPGRGYSTHMFTPDAHAHHPACTYPASHRMPRSTRALNTLFGCKRSF